MVVCAEWRKIISHFCNRNDWILKYNFYPMRYQAIPSVLFVNNRQRFMRKMQPDSIAIFHSSDQLPRNGNILYPFHQDAALFYLSGLNQPETVLVLYPDCIKEGFKELVFIKRTDPFQRVWNGDQLTRQAASEISGIQKVYWLDEMDIILHELITMSKRIYLNLEERPMFAEAIETKNKREAKKLMNEYPAHKFHRSQPLLKKIMMVKQPLEIEQIQEAVNITESAFRRVLRFIEPGKYEFEVEAEVTHEFTVKRANGHAYPPIIASGPRTCILHYVQNNQPCKAGDLLLLDIGAEYANYAADITRVVPVSGRFSDRQRQVYNAVLGILQEVKQLLVPGVLLEDYEKEVGKIIEGALIDLKLIDKSALANQNPDYPFYKKYCMHSISHHLGLSVHDLANPYDPVMAGMVFTCEPGIYIPEENIGIRLENNILVTDHGPVDLSANIPIEAAEIEELMASTVLT